MLLFPFSKWDGLWTVFISETNSFWVVWHLAEQCKFYITFIEMFCFPCRLVFPYSADRLFIEQPYFSASLSTPRQMEERKCCPCTRSSCTCCGAARPWCPRRRSPTCCSGRSWSGRNTRRSAKAWSSPTPARYVLVLTPSEMGPFFPDSSVSEKQ